jgi:tRNA 2-thiouridine synthesizing protein B
MLHTINKSPFQNNSLESCLRVAQEGSAILFIEDGVYGALKDTAVSPAVEAAMKKLKVYALAPDLDARGVKDRVIDGIELVDYSGFVDLAAESNKVQSWL